ncbi:unnamed protein product [Oreochromis niloticus]|nr:unnamed protein product [Mustela putorius furo]
MELLPFLFLSFCFLTLSGLTFAAESGTPDIRVTVKEDDDVILPCSLSTNENIKKMLFDWQKEGTLTQKNVFLLEDNGTYSCKFPDLKQETKIKLVVEPILKVRINGVAQPSVTILDQTSDWALLQCDVQSGYPKPTVEWQNSNNQTIHSEQPHVSEIGNRFYISLNTTVKKDDHYRCIATQKEIWHQSHKKIYIRLNEPWKIVAIVLAVVLVVVLALVVFWILRRHYSKNKKRQKHNKEQEPPSAQEQKLNADQSEPV